MDEWIVLAVLLVIGVPIAAIVALVMVLGARGRIARLEADVAMLKHFLAKVPIEALAEARPETAGAAVDAAATAPGKIPETPPIPDPAAIAAREAATDDIATPTPEAIAARAGEHDAAPEFADAPIAAPSPIAAKSLEERIGTRWAVWVGGLALALGLVFLVQYSIEEGYFGPAARVVFGALFSAAAIAAGEWMRRGERAAGFLARVPAAPIPAILTAAGAAGLFATVWASHAVYGFLGSGTGFVMLGLVAVATIVAALLHGPWFGVLGILAGYVTPMLVESTTPNPDALAGFLLVVTVAAFAVARVRRWRGVATAALVPALGWGAGFVDLFPPATLPEIDLAIYALGVFAATAGLLVWSDGRLAAPEGDRRLDRFGLAALAATSLLVLVAYDGDVGTLGSVVLIATLGGLVGLAWTMPAVAPAVVIAGSVAVIAVVIQDLDVFRSLVDDTLAIGTDGLVALRPKVVASFLGFHGAIAAALTAIGLLGALRATPQADRTAGWFALSAWSAPLMAVVVAWGRVSGFEGNLGFAAAAIGVAFVQVAATVRLVAKESAEAPSRAVAAAAVGAIAGLGTAAAIALDHAALTVALALMIPAIAWVHGLRPVPALKAATAIVGLVVLGRLAWDPAITADLGTTPIFNALLLGYGVPALGMGFAAWRFRSEPSDVWRAVIEGLAVIFAGLFVLAEIRHVAHGGRVLAPDVTLVETGLDVATALVLSAGVRRAAAVIGGRVLAPAAAVLGWLAAIGAVLGLGIATNPIVTGRPVGATLFGSLFFGYGVPALVAAATARGARRAGRAPAIVAATAALAYGLGFAWATLVVRRIFQGEILTHGASDAEMWAYSATWLAFGVATLAVGIKVGSKPVRLLSGVVVTATACKVFLLDLADVGGIWRAGSFLGLGLVLIGIALVYQRILFPTEPPPDGA
ncbi:DUF2339 domain-containing protein [Siculibacillus lacustris]|uniref:DUF2339 domain-containing protein n=1 Tax=Siculibacillus lacustris TaxID=1549641 RepID=A0A4Q9VHP9_9HYPH|nr:DUF2339 domain-containing protein [Siculibacillus lacustris]TBW34415.1 DUF2339 domain-containing protein [Siculibacillus lacustris]